MPMTTQEEVRLDTADGIALVGTLTLPRGESRVPAMVGVHGASSGTRDDELFLHLQSLLPPKGIATLFFDRLVEVSWTGIPRETVFV